MKLGVAYFELCYIFKHAGRVVWFAPFNAKACEALAAKLGLLPLERPGMLARFDRDRTWPIVNDVLIIASSLRE